jgi:creatinine amidohydrolase
MHRFIRTVPLTVFSVFSVLSAPSLNAQTATAGSRSAGKEPLVEFEMMTWPEVKAAIEGGKTTALVYTGGTEQRGPQNVNGGHTLMGKATVKAIALKLGNAIALPVLPYTPNNASASLPGTIGLTNELLSAILERIADQAIKTGFTSVVLMGDHGGGQPNAYAVVAKTLDSIYAPQGKHVYFCDQVYKTANGAFDEYLKAQNMPVSSHAGIPDTSEMLYLGLDLGWVRPDQIPNAVQDREHPNGISGDARPSTKELGKKIFDMKVEYAVRQIQGMIGAK